MIKRLFVAINLPKSLKEKIADFLLPKKKQLKNAFGIKWFDPEIMHITLGFLGDVEERKINTLSEIISTSVQNFFKTTLCTNSFSGFPNKDFPNIVYLETIEKGNTLPTLQKDLSNNLLKNDFIIDKRPWTPHITIARIKQKTKLDLDSWKFEPNVFEVNSIELMESVLKESGPKYMEINTFELK